MKTIGKIGCGVVLGVVAVIIIVVVLVGVGADKASKDADRYAITAKQFRKVHTGQSKHRVYQELVRPNPDDQQSFESKAPDELGGGTTKSDCDYWAKAGDLGIPSFQVCYGNAGKVESKSSF